MPARSKLDIRPAALTLAAALAALLALASAPAAAADESAGARLGRLIDEALRDGGPFFTAEERAVIERKCGYAPGSWDGFQANMMNGVFHCTNGRRLEDPEVRAIMAAAEPRIDRRVNAAMRRPEINAAIEDVAAEAEAQALQALEGRRRR